MNDQLEDCFKDIDEMFYNQVLEPFLSPLVRHITEHFLTKVSLLISLFFAQVVGFVDLFVTPEVYWWTLTILVGLDAIGKTHFLFYESPKKWRFDTFVKRTIWKSSSYIIACTAFTVASNAWEPASNYLQYGCYIGLCILELISVTGHFRWSSYLFMFFKMMFRGNFDIDELKASAEAYFKDKNKRWESDL